MRQAGDFDHSYEVTPDSAIGAFQDFSRPAHFVTGRAALEALPAGQSMYITMRVTA
jgi:hypothetical protein